MSGLRISDEIAAAMAERLGLFRKATSAVEGFKAQLAAANTCEQLTQLRAFWLDGRGASQLNAEGGDVAYGQAMRAFLEKKKAQGCP